VQGQPAYGDGAQLPWGTINASDAGSYRSSMPSPRLLSNLMNQAPPFRYNVEGVSELSPAWAQFLYDDLVQCVCVCEREYMPVPMPE
jgi:hypothetical protein